MTWFLLELCLLEYNMLSFSPSHLAAAAVLAANLSLGRTPAWSAKLQRFTGMEKDELQ